VAASLTSTAPRRFRLCSQAAAGLQIEKENEKNSLLLSLFGIFPNLNAGFCSQLALKSFLTFWAEA
jgi:hypothetical protein